MTIKGEYGKSEHGNFEVTDTIGVPHPYCITPKHVHVASAQFECGVCKGELSYAEHETSQDEVKPKSPDPAWHQPVCCKCNVPMYCRKNGIPVLDVDGDRELSLWRADKWRCFKCGAEIAVGFSRSGLEHWQEGFEEDVAGVRADWHYTECDFGVKGSYEDSQHEWALEEEA